MLFIRRLHRFNNKNLIFKSNLRLFKYCTTQPILKYSTTQPETPKQKENRIRSILQEKLSPVVLQISDISGILYL